MHIAAQSQHAPKPAHDCQTTMCMCQGLANVQPTTTIAMSQRANSSSNCPVHAAHACKPQDRTYHHFTCVGTRQHSTVDGHTPALQGVIQSFFLQATQKLGIMPFAPNTATKHSNQNKRTAEQRASTRAAPHLCPVGTNLMVLVGRCVSQQALLAQLVHGQVGCGD